VRVGAEAEVEEGEVGDAVSLLALSFFLSKQRSLPGINLHRHSSKRNRNRHAHTTRHQPIPMQFLPLPPQPLQHTPHPARIQKLPRIKTLKLHNPSVDIVQIPLTSRRQCLQSPFLKRDPAKKRISVLCDFFLPAFLGFFPVCPERAGFRYDAVCDWGFCGARGELGGDALAVD
jgi:hypothetical protein